MRLSAQVGLQGHTAGLWRVYPEAPMENNMHPERAPFSAVNFPNELADNKATWK